MNLTFVYGTLKRGNALYGQLEGSEFVGEAITMAPAFRMFCNGTYPYVANAFKGGYRVSGELFKVSDDTLDTLDRLEGHPQHYCRKSELFMLEDGSMAVGQIYIYAKPIWGCKEIKSGCWFSPKVKKSTRKNLTT